MAITADTWAVVAATGLGPVLAVALTLGFTYWRETSGAKYNRRLNVFRTLMATRRVGISPDHVNAINLVEVDFYGCKAVETEWKIYKNHLNDNSKADDEAWRRTKERLLSKLLFEIAKVLKFDIQAIAGRISMASGHDQQLSLWQEKVRLDDGFLEIFEGGYAPGGWAHRDMRYTGALEYIHELREGTKTLPLWVHGVTAPPPAEPPPAGPGLPRANG